MRPLSVLLAMLTVCAAGFGLTTWLTGRRGKIRLPELAAYSWLLGTAFVSLATWILPYICPNTCITSLVALACIAMGIGGLQRFRRGAINIEWPGRLSLFEICLCVLISVEVAMVLWNAAISSMGWDGLFSWENKARTIFANEGRLSPAFFAIAENHPDYPLLVPLNEAWIYRWIGGWDEFWVRIFFPPFYIVCALLFYIGVARAAGRRSDGLIAASMLFFIPAVIMGPGGMDSGYADFPLAVFYLAAAVLLILPNADEQDGRLPLFAITAALLPWVKQEGLILWICLMIAGGCVIRARRPALRFALMATPGIVIIGAWKIYLHAMHAVTSSDFKPVTFKTFLENAGRLGVIFQRLMQILLETGRWSLLWPGFLAAIVYLCFTKRVKPAGILLMLAALPLLVVCSSYVFSAGDLSHHIDTSLPRIILQSAPIALLVIALAMAEARTGGKRD